VIDLIKWFFDVFMHLDKYLGDVITTYGTWTYLLLFAIIFCETGLVATPILPGDSLLFAAGTFAAGGRLNVGVLFILLAIAAVAGDTVNYWIGYFVGPKVFKKEKSLLFNRAYLDRAHRFYEKYGSEAIIIARFIPIVRTFIPFVAGIGKMSYWKFISYNVIGGVTWIALFIFGGYFFGNLKFVQEHFSYVIVAIILISVTPMGIEFILAWREKRAHPDAAKEASE
jgi:membrane-associated protein